MTARICVFAFCAIALTGGGALAWGEDRPREDKPVQRVVVLRPPDFDGAGEFGEDVVERIDGWLRGQLVQAGLPSASVAIVRDGEIEYERAFGFADVARKRKATAGTPYHVASVTKVFTTTLAAVLDERGVIDLDAPVVRYLPTSVKISRTPDVGARITLRQLASHTSGLPSSVKGSFQSVEGRYQLDPKRLYDQLAKVELLFEPGTDDRYSNLGVGLLGHVLEQAADVPLETLAQREILAPLGMSHSAMGPAQPDELGVATGYGPLLPRSPFRHGYATRLMGSGGLVASAPDLARFLAAQMKPGRFSRDVLAELQAPTKLSNGKVIDRGLGWRLRRSESIGSYVGKNGGRVNCSAWIGFAPEHAVGVAVVTNCGHPDVDQLGRWLLERSVPEVKPKLLDREPVVERRYAKVAPFTGVRWVDDQPEVRVDGEWSRLTSIDGLPTSRITAFSKARFDERARQRFSEDLVEVLSTMGHDPDWTVALELEMADGKVEKRRVRMTEENRDRVRDGD